MNKATHESVRLLEYGDWRGCLVGVCVVWAQLVCYSLDCACCVYHKGSGVSRSTLPASLFEHPSMGQAFGLLTKITKNSSSSRRPNLVIRVSFNACLRPPEQQNAPLKPEANTLDIDFPQTRTPLQRDFQHMFYAPPGDTAANSAKFHIRSKYRIHWHGTLVDDEFKPSSTGILCVAQSDSLRAVRTWTQSSTHSNDACPTISWAIRLHSFLSGSGSLAAWRSCVFPHRDTPTLMDAAQQGTLLSVCQAVQFRLPPS